MARATVIDGKKKCPHCGETKPLDLFYKKGDDQRASWCKSCGNAARLVSANTDSGRASRRDRHAKNPNAVRARAGAWRKSNSDKIKGYNRASYDGHKEARRAYARAYKAKNAERIAIAAKSPRALEVGRMKTQRYRERNPGAHQLRSALGRARKVGRAVGGLPRETVEYARIILADPCSYCGEPGGVLDHINPIVRGGTFDWYNIAPACRSCNAKKGKRTLLQFLLAVAS